MTLFGICGAVEFVNGRIHTAVGGEEVEYIGFFRFVLATGAKWGDIDVCGRVVFEAFIMHSADS